MILQCPECSVKFMVPDTAIGSGRDVRCGKCAHSWFVEGNAADTDEVEEAVAEGTKSNSPEPDEKAELKPIPKGSSLPAVIEKQGASAAMVATCAVMIMVNVMLGLITFRNEMQPLAPWLYAPLGIYHTSEVKIADFNFEQRALGKKSRITLDCNLINTGDEVRRVPVLKARIMSVDDGVLGKDSNLLKEGKLIKPGETYSCGKIRMTNPFSSATKLVLDLGNPFEIGLRD